MKLLFLLLSTFSCLSAFSQMQIKGHVVNAETGVAIPSASVFISNTSKGTTSNSRGYFELNELPGGKQDLVISCIGYETNVLVFNSTQLPLLLKIEMSVKVKELEGVTVEPSVEETWEKWGTTFLNNFVGTSANASQCKIKNEKAIHFRYYKKSNKLVAYSDEPVLLENKALGYLITYQLEKFEMNFQQKAVFFHGYSLFKSADREGREKDKWKKKRSEAYKGSIMQFMRSIYNNRIAAEGFEVRRMVNYPNTEKQRVKKLIGPLRMKLADKSNPVLNITALQDTLAYYESMMRQDDEIIRHGNHLLNADSLVRATAPGVKEIFFPDYLYVTYKNELEEPGYLLTQYPQRRATWQRSYVTLIDGNPIVIDRSGNYFDPLHFLTSAYWGWSEKLANTLPLDYEPDAGSKK